MEAQIGTDPPSSQAVRWRWVELLDRKGSGPAKDSLGYIAPEFSVRCLGTDIEVGAIA